ncbi:MAG TPA: hypothetical protein VHH32_02815 [Gemmatimonadales bacterium]|nr:hypothetical protein [Gemmatimonadales bacterium]
MEPARLTSRHTIREFPVRLWNTRPEIDSAQVLARLGQALDLIATYAPHRFRRMRRDLAGIVVQRFPCRGAFFPQTSECLVELTFTVNPQHTIAEIAASMVHEGIHARIARMCGTLPEAQRAREERLCRRAELEFGRLLPDGEVVIERARQALAMADQEVAPIVDWAEGARRVAAADQQKGHS